MLLFLPFFLLSAAIFFCFPELYKIKPEKADDYCFELNNKLRMNLFQVSVFGVYFRDNW
jgi:hypothetical protein